MPLALLYVRAGLQKKVDKFFSARTISKLVQCAPLAPTNISSKSELSKTSVKSFALYCASIVDPWLSLLVHTTIMEGKSRGIRIMNAHRW